jgi:acetyltransferase-like isoleucine patch superfamily enzyme
MYKMDIGNDVQISHRAILDRSINPRGIHIGSETLITRGVVVLAHDYCRSIKENIFIGKRCFIGINSIILPGIKIGDEVVIAAGSVVTKDIPSNCIAAGVPAKVIKQGIHTRKHGVIIPLLPNKV